MNNVKNVVKGNLEESAQEMCNFGSFINTVTKSISTKTDLLEQLCKCLSQELNCRPTMTIVRLMLYVLLTLTELTH
jgi:hypothetical protein